MAKKDLYNQIKVAQCLASASLSATTTGTAVDTAGFESVAFAINVGTGVDTTNKLTVSLVEGDTSGTLTDVAAADYLGATFDITATGVYKIGYRGNKRYVAVKLTETGTVSTTVAITAVLADPRLMPTT